MTHQIWLQDAKHRNAYNALFIPSHKKITGNNDAADKFLMLPTNILMLPTNILMLTNFLMLPTNFLMPTNILMLPTNILMPTKFLMLPTNFLMLATYFLMLLTNILMLPTNILMPTNCLMLPTYFLMPTYFWCCNHPFGWVILLNKRGNWNNTRGPAPCKEAYQWKEVYKIWLVVLFVSLSSAMAKKNCMQKKNLIWRHDNSESFFIWFD